MPSSNFEEFVRAESLVPIHVPRVIGLFVEALGRVPVEDRTAKRHVVLAVAVAANRQVPAGHHELDTGLGVRIAEDCDRLLLAVPARIVFELLLQAVVPFRIVKPPEQGLDDVLLVGGKEVRC